jgi:hypothetical protein
LNKLYLEEEQYWQQRYRLKWILEGDSNTQFFHTVASNNKRKNFIFSLEIDGSMDFDQNILRKHVIDFYRNLLGTTTTRIISLQPNFWDSCTKLTVEQIAFLESPFLTLHSSITIGMRIFLLIPLLIFARSGLMIRQLYIGQSRL